MDLKTLGSDLGLEEEEFIELVELFLVTAKKDLYNLGLAYHAGDADRVAESAHSLKGSSGNLGFRELSKLSKIAEDKGGENDLDGILEIIESMNQKIDQIEACLNKTI